MSEDEDRDEVALGLESEENYQDDGTAPPELDEEDDFSQEPLTANISHLSLEQISPRRPSSSSIGE